MRPRVLPALLTALCLLAAPVARAQAQDNAQPAGAEAKPPAPSAEADDYVIGAMPGEPRGEYYRSPLKKFGTDLFLAPYALGAFAGLIYLVSVYPIQALVGSSHVEGVMPWLLVPVLGPWMAQYTRHVKDEPFWRGVLIADAGIQAAGLLLALLGELLSGWRELPPRSQAGLDLDVGVANGGVSIRLMLRSM